MCSLVSIARSAKKYLFSPPVDNVLAVLFDGLPTVVVQVGSNDGVQEDPIAKLINANADWQVLFIEPLPHLFKRLKADYSGSQNYCFENVAVSERKETIILYYVSDEFKKSRKDAPFWYDQLGSFEEFEPFIVSEKVCCERFQDIVKRNGIDKIDLLHIDTEGYDYEVLRQGDLKTTPPRVILYEHKHLSRIDQFFAMLLLWRNGYFVRPYKSDDTLAVMNY